MWRQVTTVVLALALVVLGGVAAEAAEEQSSKRSSVSGRSLDALVEDVVLVQLAETAWVGDDFDVRAKDGVVTLTGTVPSEATKARIGRIARGTIGVTDVRNELRVDPSVALAASSADDDELARRVALQIAAALPDAKTGEDWWFDGWRVEGPDKVWSFVIQTQNGRVYLDGDVSRLLIKRKAIDAARQTPGVQSVRSDLELDRLDARYPYGPFARHLYSLNAPYASHPYAYDPEYFVYDFDAVPPEPAASITGRVMYVDRQSGRLTLQTDSRTMQMSLPPSALKGVQRGEHLMLQVDIAESEPAASPPLVEPWDTVQAGEVHIFRRHQAP
jgi:hyperosmotically inducible protein